MIENNVTCIQCAIAPCLVGSIGKMVIKVCGCLSLLETIDSARELP